MNKMDGDTVIPNRISSQRQDEGYSLPQQSKLNREAAAKDGRIDRYPLN